MANSRRRCKEVGTPMESWGAESPSDSPSPWSPHCPRGLCSSENQPSAKQVAILGFLMKPMLLGCRIQLWQMFGRNHPKSCLHFLQLLSLVLTFGAKVMGIPIIKVLPRYHRILLNCQGNRASRGLLLECYKHTHTHTHTHTHRDRKEKVSRRERLLREKMQQTLLGEQNSGWNNASTVARSFDKADC